LTIIADYEHQFKSTAIEHVYCVT